LDLAIVYVTYSTPFPVSSFRKAFSSISLGNN